MLKFADITGGSGSQTTPEDTRGFALPTVLVLLVVLGALTSFLLSGSSDAQKAGLAIRASARSFYAAEAGLNEVLGDWQSASYAALAPNPGDSADLGWTTMSNGDQYRVVFARIDGGKTGPAIHSLRVVGLGADRFGGSTTIFREIGAGSGGAQTLFDGGNAAVEGGTGGKKVKFTGGASDKISGLDVVPAGWPGCDPPDDKPGILWDEDANITGENATNLKGNPQYVEDPTLTKAGIEDFGGIDFDDLVAMANFTITSSSWGPTLGPVVSGGVCDTSVSSNWGAPTDPSSPCFDHFPIIYFKKTNGTQRFKGKGSGQAIILVDNGNMEFEGLSGEFNFYGIIIVRGPAGEGLEITDTDFHMFGAVISTADVVMDGGEVNYSQCAVRRALEANGMSQNPSAGVTERLWRQSTD